MGNCAGKRSKKSAAKKGIVPSEVVVCSPVVRLYASASCPWTSWLRIALSYKSVSVQYIPSEPSTSGLRSAILECGNQTFSGPHEMLLRYIDARFPDPPLLDPAPTAQPALAKAVTLQHRCMSNHLERIVKWAEDLAARSAKRSLDPSAGSPRMEVRKFGRFYSQLHEVMLEHAQVEERVVFPVLESADRGLCVVANDEHARDLPIINGIKEDIKSIGVLDTGTHAYQEAMVNISARLKILQVNFKGHFEEEEQELLPLLEAAELGREQQEQVLGRCLEEVMQSTHSTLLEFFISGLSPREAMQYLGLVAKCCDRQWATALLQSLTTGSTEGSLSLSCDAHKA